MSKLVWDKTGERLYETGVENGVLYPQVNGEYPKGVAWNGLTGVNENPSGAEITSLYADNIQYLNLMSAEKFGATIEAYMYPDEFAICDGSAEAASGVFLGQQKRYSFGLSYVTKLGNDTDGTDYGYKIHIIYGALASPSGKDYSTVNESPEAITFSWELSTTPVKVKGFKPTASLVIDSTKSDPNKLKALEDILYGIDLPGFSASKTYAVGDRVTKDNKCYVCKTAISTAAAWDSAKWDEIENPGPRLPLPDEIVELMGENGAG